jgi:hypothetical protein
MSAAFEPEIPDRPFPSVHACAREAAGNQRPWPADKVERWGIDRLIPYANLQLDGDRRTVQRPRGRPIDHSPPFTRAGARPPEIKGRGPRSSAGGSTG